MLYDDENDISYNVYEVLGNILLMYLFIDVNVCNVCMYMILIYNVTQSINE